MSDVHHVHAWALTSGRYVFAGHLQAAENADPQGVLSAAHEMLKTKVGFFLGTLQVEKPALMKLVPRRSM